MLAMYNVQYIQEVTLSVKAWWQWGSDFHLRFPAVALSLSSNTHQRRTSLDGDNKEKKVETIYINKRWRTWYLMGARVKKAMSPSSHSDLFYLVGVQLQILVFK